MEIGEGPAPGRWVRKRSSGPFLGLASLEPSEKCRTRGCRPPSAAAAGGMSGRAARKKKLVRTRPVSESDSSGEEIADVGAGEAPALTRLGPWEPQGMGEASRWQRAGVKGVEIKAGQISLASGTSWVGPAPGGGNTKVPPRAKLDEPFQENHRAAVGQGGHLPPHNSGFPFPGFLGNGTRRVSLGIGDSEAHVTAVVGSEGEGSPPPPPPPDWSDPPENHGEGGTLADTDTESIPSSTHSSVLVDMGKVVGVLRTYTSSQADRALLEPADSNGAEDEDEDEDDCISDSGSVTGAEVCATCAEEARGQDSELDSLCGDPLVYATFVAPVHQYSTETEPSRQPSIKQNSSEAEGCPPPASAPAQVRTKVYLV